VPHVDRNPAQLPAQIVRSAQPDDCGSQAAEYLADARQALQLLFLKDAVGDVDRDAAIMATLSFRP